MPIKLSRTKLREWEQIAEKKGRRKEAWAIIANKEMDPLERIARLLCHNQRKEYEGVTIVKDSFNPETGEGNREEILMYPPDGREKK